MFFFFQAEDGIRDVAVTGVQTCALPISWFLNSRVAWSRRFLPLSSRIGRRCCAPLEKPVKSSGRARSLPCQEMTVFPSPRPVGSIFHRIVTPGKKTARCDMECKPMEKRYLLILTLLLGLLLLFSFRTSAQQDTTRLRVVVNLVQLNVAVTDNKGNYVTGLHPLDFAITEDGTPENIATFEEGNGPTTRLVDITADVGKNGADESASAQGRARMQDSASGSSFEDPPETLSSALAGANVFILFDTSNYMYRGFVFAQDAIADFVRSLESADRVAFYSYSRDLYRAAALTSDRSEVVRGVRTSVAGGGGAVHNSVVVTGPDACPQP